MPKNALQTSVLLSVLFFWLAGCSQSSEEAAEEETSEEVAFVRDELSVQHGQELFNQYCASCHNFDENSIGPNLSGVTTEVEKEWLVSFINNAPKVIDSGDERAQELFATYKQYMPAFTMLEDEQIEHILGFIHKFSQGQQRSQNNRPGGILDPVKEKVPSSNLTLVLEKIMTLPSSSEEAPLARINKLQAIESPSGERLFMHDLRGKLFEIKDDSPVVYLDLAAQQPDFMENPGYATGFGSFDFHPEFEENGLLYTTHTEPGNTATADFPLPDSIDARLQWVVLEWKTDDPQADTFSGTPRELLRVDMYGTSHGVQELTFNPLAQPGDDDYGLIYLSVGDGGAGIRYPFLPDNDGKLIWGSVIRIDPAGTNSANGKYGIPPDNPFVGDSEKVSEVWARGFRNPHRISWDPTGSEKMFITNIGQHSVEEVNLGIAGGDYGWPNREGTFLFDPLANPEIVYPLPEDDSGYVYPVAQYDHDEGNAISGGFVYGGTKVPELKGKYVFGDIPRGKIFYAEVSEMNLGEQATVYRLDVEFNGEKTDLETITQNRRVDLRFGTNTEGELYIFTKSNAALYKVVGCKKSSSSLEAG